MRGFVGITILSCLSAATASAQSPSYCRSTVTVTQGQPIDGRFLDFELGLVLHALAEKFCGAKAIPMGPKFLGYVEGQGCGPETEVYQDVEKSITYLERASLALLAQDGDPKGHLTEKQAQAWATSTVQELGGCERLVKWHDSDLDSQH